MLDLEKLKTLHKEKSKNAILPNKYHNEYGKIISAIYEFWEFLYNNTNPIVIKVITERFDYHINVYFRWSMDSRVNVIIHLDRNYQHIGILPPLNDIEIQTNKKIQDITEYDINQIILKFGKELSVNHIIYKEEI